MIREGVRPMGSYIPRSRGERRDENMHLPATQVLAI